MGAGGTSDIQGLESLQGMNSFLCKLSSWLHCHSISLTFTFHRLCTACCSLPSLNMPHSPESGICPLSGLTCLVLPCLPGKLLSLSISSRCVHSSRMHSLLFGSTPGQSSSERFSCALFHCSANAQVTSFPSILWALCRKGLCLSLCGSPEFCTVTDR